ncbi:Rz1-like lysis system protein LysC [Bordetella bronchialis]|uniref:Rz1-like lysis system protein LysC n=1 Tax=Bordetella bronchialis TaxID=463025 RepID=UPI003D046460
MKTRKFVPGPILCCLLILPGCAPIPPSPGPTLTLNTCPAVTPCVLPATAPTRNGDLNLALERAESAWAVCAAQVDAIYQCQSRADHAQAR